MSRTGKIARLPRSIRDELNQRLEDGEPGVRLVEWLNGHRCVQTVLEEHFGGRAISEQNLSEWRQGGFLDWQRNEEARADIAALAEHSDDLGEAAADAEISDRLASVVSVEFMRVARAMLEEKSDSRERWQCLREILHELSQLRRDDHRAVRTIIRRDRWRREVEQLEAEEDKEELERLRKRTCDLIWAPLHVENYAKLFGGGDHGRHLAALYVETMDGLEHGSLTKMYPYDLRQNSEPAASEKASESGPDGDQAESDQIRSNQT
jgi:hypothetical protein